jgi:hypothetical protein
MCQKQKPLFGRIVAGSASGRSMSKRSTHSIRSMRGLNDDCIFIKSINIKRKKNDLLNQK